MQNIIPDKQDFFKYFLTKNLYDYCEINEYADVVIKELMDYYQVYIGTAYVFPEVLRSQGLYYFINIIFIRKVSLFNTAKLCFLNG